MITEYIEAAISKARYELIKDEEPYYGEVPELEGSGRLAKRWKNAVRIWRRLLMAGIIVRLRKELPLPPIGEYEIEELSKVEVSA